MYLEHVGHVADGEADDRRAPGPGQGHSEEPHSSGHADGLRPPGVTVPGEQVGHREMMGLKQS